MQTRTSASLDSAVVLVITAGVFVDIAIYQLMGWRLAGDSPRYLDGAHQLMSGAPLSERQLGYVGYIALLAAFDRVGLGLVAVRMFQLALSLTAGCCALALCRAWAGERAGVICGFAWILFVDIQRWNFYIATDGPFISTVMGCCYLVWRARTSAWTTLFVTACALAMMAALRINGMFFAAFFCIYLMVGMAERARRVALAGLLLATIVGLPAGRQLIEFVSHSQNENSVVREGTYKFLVEGHVIWNTTFAPMPPPDSGAGGGPRDIVVYVLRHPVAVAELYGLRLTHYLLADSPRYSARHRLANLIMWPVFYLLVIIGFLSIAKRDAWAAGLAVLWACQAAIVTLTVGDYDGRYSLYAVPALLPFAAAGVDRLAARAGFAAAAGQSVT